MHLVPLARRERVVVKTFDIVPVDLCVVLVLEVHTFSLVFEVMVLGIHFGTFGNVGQGTIHGGGHIRGPDVGNRGDSDGG